LPNSISLSIIIPTYNEAQNILPLIVMILNNLPRHLSSEIIIVDDNSPDGTGMIVFEKYMRNKPEDVAVIDSLDKFSYKCHDNQVIAIL
jgi:glycosyltransferase involved in cell wall biosynthesis